MTESRAATASAGVCSYFVDESGDGVLFDSKGRILVGGGSSPRHFILGLADVPDPEGLTRAMEVLRAGLVADPYFHGVPSMQPAEGKMARTMPDLFYDRSMTVL